MSTTEDLRWMKEALRLARRGEGGTRPNPPVGAVVVRRGRCVGRGYHHAAGTPHAEVHALRAAGPAARGATLYVTLEPCCTFGRTPPCTEAIRTAGIRRVVVACRDPNPRHRGRGLRQLKRAGLRITVGVCAAEAERLLAPFAKWVTTGLPFVTLKLGMTLDGRIADRHGRSRWITSEASRAVVQELRRTADAVLVGRQTAELDNPALLYGGRRPGPLFRVVTDSKGILPKTLKLFSDEHRHQTIYATTRRCPLRKIRELAQRGVQVWLFGGGHTRVPLPSLLAQLGEEGFLHVLCEGGGELAASLIRVQLVDEYRFFLAPRILGGTTAPAAVAGEGFDLGTDPQVRILEVTHCGTDLAIRAQPARHAGRE